MMGNAAKVQYRRHLCVGGTNFKLCQISYHHQNRKKQMITNDTPTPIEENTNESKATTEIGRADRSPTSLRRYVAIVAQDRATRRAQAVVSLEIVSSQPSHEFLRVTPVVEGFRISTTEIDDEVQHAQMFRVSVNGIDNVELDRGVMSGDALNATVNEMYDVRAKLSQWKIVHDGVTRLSGVFSEAEMVTEIVEAFVSDAHNQVELIPLSCHQTTFDPPRLRNHIGRIVGNAALIVKKFRLSPTFEVAWMPHLRLPGTPSESAGCWGLIRDNVVSWTMLDTTVVMFWFMFLDINFRTPLTSVAKVFREIPVRFDDATITWKGNVFCDIWGWELNDVVSFRDEFLDGDWHFVMEELERFGSVKLSSRMSSEFFGAMLYVTTRTIREREGDPTPLYPDTLGLLQLNAYYRLLHNLMRVVVGAPPMPMMRIKVRCDGSPIVLVFSSLVDRSTSDSDWQVDVLEQNACILGAQGTFRQLCNWVLNPQRLSEQKWESWFDTSRRRLHITAKTA
jgi:hypothetical protein